MTYEGGDCRGTACLAMTQGERQLAMTEWQNDGILIVLDVENRANYPIAPADSL